MIIIKLDVRGMYKEYKKKDAFYALEEREIA